jgi:hypothetical protein
LPIRVFIFVISVLAGLAVSRNIWTRSAIAPLELRIHISSLALGYILFVAFAFNELARLISRSKQELTAMTAARLIATVAATTGYLFGLVWAVHYKEYVALLRPVLMTDLFVIGLAWFIATKPLRNRPATHWDIGLGLAALASWYLSALP